MSSVPIIPANDSRLITVFVMPYGSTDASGNPLLKSGYVALQVVQQQETLVVSDQQTVRNDLASLNSAQTTVRENGTLTTPGMQSTSSSSVPSSFVRPCVCRSSRTTASKGRSPS